MNDATLHSGEITQRVNDAYPPLVFFHLPSSLLNPAVLSEPPATSWLDSRTNSSVRSSPPARLSSSSSISFFFNEPPPLPVLSPDVHFVTFNRRTFVTSLGFFYFFWSLELHEQSVPGGQEGSFGPKHGTGGGSHPSWIRTLQSHPEIGALEIGERGTRGSAGVRRRVRQVLRWERGAVRRPRPGRPHFKMRGRPSGREARRSGATPLEVLAEVGVVGRRERRGWAAPGPGEVARGAAGPVVGLVLVGGLVVVREEVLVAAVAVLVRVVVGLVLVVQLVRLLVIRTEHGLVLVVVDDHPPDDAVHAGAAHGVGVGPERRLFLGDQSAAGRVGAVLKVLLWRRG